MSFVRLSPHRRRGLLLRIPVFGWILRDLEVGGTRALVWLLVAIVCGAGVLTLSLGLPGLVLGMLGLTALAFLAIIHLAKP